MKLVVLAAVLLLTACDASAPESGAPTADVGVTSEAGGTAVLGPRGVGAVRLGMTSAELEATGEIGADVTTPEFACVIRELTAADGWVGLQDGVAVEIRVDGAARTPEGLRIGDSRARMHEVYPGVEQYPHGFIRPLDAETGYKFFFENAGDTLTGIGLVRADRGCLT
ncbi:hypothetical protein FHX81_4238 [Saccharothrix saharensis]|uniref:Lipoprotein n=1 Tax=Saccharothrix saharensis TaxID=571190 RepID=A0A543JGH9_9PSEU|nr:hypothetical protein [Saccharothrix saharensis]TQM81854.1 hypothetical protein FHX81_4238 [Saccharothrix saharensis]